MIKWQRNDPWKKRWSSQERFSFLISSLSFFVVVVVRYFLFDFRSINKIMKKTHRHTQTQLWLFQWTKMKCSLNSMSCSLKAHLVCNWHKLMCLGLRHWRLIWVQVIHMLNSLYIFFYFEILILFLLILTKPKTITWAQWRDFFFSGFF